MFCGTAGVAYQLEQGINENIYRRSLVIVRWDKIFGPDFDVLSEKGRARFDTLVQSGHICGSVWGFPCDTFTRARKFDWLGPLPLRLPSWPALIQGRPGLSDFERSLVADGNALLRLTLDGISLIKHYIPESVNLAENPTTSLAWDTPDGLALLALLPHHIDIDFCQYSPHNPWFKSTRFVSDSPRVKQWARQCPVPKGSRAPCPCAGCPHIPLKGRAPAGRYWAEIAEPWPQELCYEIAQTLAAST